MARSSRIFAAAGHHAADRVYDLVTRLRFLLRSLPPIPDAFSPDDLPISFILKRDSPRNNRRRVIRRDNKLPISQDVGRRREAHSDPDVLKAAEDWLNGAATDVRDDRFAPIADQATATWQFLRQNSNVDLGRIELAGARTSHHVTLDVTVDGVRGAALGVMSRGELHALALSLFLPRATLPENSPFWPITCRES